MSKFKFVMGAIALAGAMQMGSSAYAFENKFNNYQFNYAPVFAKLELFAKWVGGDLRASSIAIGNNFTAETDGSTRILTQQTQLSPVGAELKAQIKDAGSVDLTVAGICNNASIENEQSHTTSIDNVQRCNTTDPYAYSDVYANLVGGDFGLSNVAIGNNLSIDMAAANSWVGNTQANAGAVYASVNAAVENVGGAVDVTVAAIGNNASITQRFGN